MLLRRVARPLLAGIFISGGLDAMLDPAPRAAKAGPLLARGAALADSVPVDTSVLTSADPTTVVRADATLKIVAGTMLALGWAPRPAATLLAVSLVPTTVAGHPFWQEKDDAVRAQQRIHFMKNVGLLGGLLLASADTQGKPSVGWRARRAGRRAERAAGLAVEHVAAGADRISGRMEKLAGTTSGGVAELTGRVGGRMAELAGAGQALTGRARRKAAKAASKAGKTTRKVRRKADKAIGRSARRAGETAGALAAAAGSAVGGR
jgi:uncharacterized membrane protein YphA (DoxX/SURF4 family)